MNHYNIFQTLLFKHFSHKVTDAYVRLPRLQSAHKYIHSVPFFYWASTLGLYVYCKKKKKRQEAWINTWIVSLQIAAWIRMRAYMWCETRNRKTGQPKLFIGEANIAIQTRFCHGYSITDIAKYNASCISALFWWKQHKSSVISNVSLHLLKNKSVVIWNISNFERDLPSTAWLCQKWWKHLAEQSKKKKSLRGEFEPCLRLHTPGQRLHGCRILASGKHYSWRRSTDHWLASKYPLPP